MRSTVLFLLLLILNSSGTFSQSGLVCGNGRYDTEIFSTVKLTSNITYGSNVDYTGASTTLTMDIYEPDSDTVAVRPLIVWAHGGSFMGGTKNDADVTSLCNHFAKRGYVCVSINYRLGINIPPNQTGATQAVYRAVQDMKAAIRFMRKDAATSNVYKVDTNFIVAGGSSAGAFTALHLAYLDDVSELPAQIDTTALGGMEGNSGNPGYSSQVNAVVNLCGALGNKTWLHPGDEPLCSMHGTNDNVVPYATAMLYLLNIWSIMVVDGSYSVNDYANTVGLDNVMYTYYGQDHVPYAGSLAYMDTTVRFVSNFLYRQLGCTPSDPLPLPNTFPSTGVSDLILDNGNISIYPNPASEQITIELNQADEKIEHIQFYSYQGKLLSEKDVSANKISIQRNELPAGMYLLRIRSKEHTWSRRVNWN
ncbi:MAG TPA: T9SS type A sorting domain-containing protein [Bacteroidia bacterium]|nr:T9SS type A sorting domain-containing protein [Bacteroidia bacterium]